MNVSSISSANNMVRPGKAAQSVGHMAKAAVTAAKEAGAVLPKNAQGLAASAVAHGVDPATLFESMIPPPPAVEDTPPDDGATAPDPDPVQAAEAGFGEAATITGGVTTGAETALELLQESVDVTV
ncbi:hypothetical protein EI983_00590 [Roseovarius faecimaris]|uniref:Uncharacterized protein n=1 Tax=Roseovarius faecimaris TaxID=2494550 RepID=A0A6I6INU5_9RHOB|nr:hypothetical protein [Roseovarius faecimaris]QGX96856.1 hypothetical protein EI983_00590 [Roseovarius faecimaris]